MLKSMNVVGDKVFVSFTCQRCSQCLTLDDTLNNLSQHISAELNLPVHYNPDVDLESQATTSFDQYVPPCRLSDSGNGGNNGFMLISDGNEVDLLSQRFKVKADLFDHLSASSNIDHPLCDECTDHLIELLEHQLANSEKDLDDYYKYYQSLQSAKEERKLNELEHDLHDLKSDEARLCEELDSLQNAGLETLKGIDEQEEISIKISQEENRYRKEYVKHKRDWQVADDEGRSLECQLSSSNNHLDKLKRTNVFNATFHIWHKGHFGTINNFCLGRLPSAPVDWSEINAAWGQTALLLSALSRKINLSFDRYRLVPYGNHSFIELTGEQKELPLYGSGGFKFLWDTKFDHGMVAFLDCLQQFQEKVEKVEKNNKVFCFPYRTNKGKIEDSDHVSYSVKIQLNSEEQWTKALKYMLTNLKWGLAWVASQFNSDGEEILVPHI